MAGGGGDEEGAELGIAADADDTSTGAGVGTEAATDTG